MQSLFKNVVRVVSVCCFWSILDIKNGLFLFVKYLVFMNFMYYFVYIKFMQRINYCLSKDLSIQVFSIFLCNYVILCTEIIDY